MFDSLNIEDGRSSEYPQPIATLVQELIRPIHIHPIVLCFFLTDRRQRGCTSIQPHLGPRVKIAGLHWSGSPSFGFLWALASDSICITTCMSIRRYPRSSTYMQSP